LRTIAVKNIDSFRAGKYITDAPAFQFIVKSLSAVPSDAPVFRGIVKLHKKAISARPIIPLCRHQLANFSLFLHTCLKHFVSRIPHCIQNSAELLLMLDSIRLQPEDLVITLDVTAMYLNISVDEAIEVALKYISSDVYMQFYWRHDLRSFWSSALRMVLTETEFQHNGRWFRQVDGLSMGNFISPVLANLVCASREEANNIGDNPVILFYARFLDDVFIILRGIRNIKADMLPIISRLLKSDRPDDKLSFDLSTMQCFNAKQMSVGGSITYLDVELRTEPRVDGTFKFTSEMHIKPLSAYSYVPFKSAHARCNLKAMVKGECLRRLLL
jgi:hypothetical protein